MEGPSLGDVVQAVQVHVHARRRVPCSLPLRARENTFDRERTHSINETASVLQFLSQRAPLAVPVSYASAHVMSVLAMPHTTHHTNTQILQDDLLIFWFRLGAKQAHYRH